MTTANRYGQAQKDLNMTEKQAHQKSFLNYMLDNVGKKGIIYSLHQNQYSAKSTDYQGFIGYGSNEDEAQHNLLIQIEKQIKEHHPLY